MVRGMGEIVSLHRDGSGHIGSPDDLDSRDVWFQGSQLIARVRI
jgi:hypothetical protein